MRTPPSHNASSPADQRDKLLQGVAQATQALLAIGDFGRALYEAFQRLQEAANVDRVYLFENHTDPDTGALLMSQRYEWPRSNIGPEVDHPGFQNIPYAALPSWEAILRSGQPVSGPVSTFPETEREILQAMGTRSVLIAPIFIEGRFWGYIGFDDCTRERLWSDGERSALLTAANSIGAAYVRVRAKEALAESQARYQRVVESVREVIFQMDPQGRWTFLNPAWTEITGFDVVESLERDVLTFVHPDDHAHCAAMQQELATGAMATCTCEIRFLTSRETYRWVEVRARRADGGDGITGTLYDVTERRRAAEALQRANDELETRVAERTAELQASEARFRALVQNSSDIITKALADGTIDYESASVERLFGYRPQERMGAKIFDYIHPDDLPRVQALFDTCVQQRGARVSASFRFRKADGHWTHVHSTAVNRLHDPAVRGVVINTHDIAERLQAEAKIRQQAALLDKARDAIFVIGLDRTVTYWNKSAERLYGWLAEEALGRDARDVLFAAEDSRFADAYDATLARAEWIGELRQVDREGQALIVESRWTLVKGDDGKPDTILLVNTDISERKALEAQFLRAQRMESLGTLAGGIAHDLNNVLGPILMSVQLLKQRLADGRSLKLLDTLELSAQHGADLVRKVLAFARGAEGKRVTVYLKSLVGETVRIIQDTFPRSITIESHIKDDLYPVEGDVTQLHQVLMNLCVNARDAMPDGGRLAIRLTQADVTEQQARLHMHATPGRYVVLSVRDTGIGMAPDVVDKIFEPFYTTKQHGTGLGLATTVGIVKGHGGFISVQSEVGAGTEFRVYLPVGTDQPAPDVAEVQGDLPQGQGELILVVDDEASLRMVAREVLTANGYRVLTAANGADAIERFSRHPEPIALVFTDVMMPEMDGYALANALRRIDGSVPIIATSGLANQAQVHAETDDAVRAFLPKPYEAAQLLQAVHRVLHDQADASVSIVEHSEGQAGP